MTRRRTELENLATIPPIFTHAQWCRWLRSRGTLASGHSRCCEADRCVASDKPAPEWRKPQRLAP